MYDALGADAPGSRAKPAKLSAEVGLDAVELCCQVVDLERLDSRPLCPGTVGSSICPKNARFPAMGLGFL